MIGAISSSPAKLQFSAEAITLSCTLGSYTFSPEQVISLDAFGAIPLFGQGIRIRHNNAHLPTTIVFLCIFGRRRIFRALSGLGFRPCGQAGPRAGGMAVHPGIGLGFVLVWIAQFALDHAYGFSRPDAPGPFACAALLISAGFLAALRYSTRLQASVLRPGRQLAEIDLGLRLLLLLCGALMVIFAFLLMM